MKTEIKQEILWYTVIFEVEKIDVEKEFEKLDKYDVFGVFNYLTNELCSH